MRILIIGGTGSIATYVAAELNRQGHEITVVTRGHAPVPAEYKQIIADREQPREFIEALRQWQGDVSYDFICMRPEHAEVIHEALNDRTRQHFFISTAAVYDKSSPACLPLVETAPHNRRGWEYALRKSQCEEFFLARCAEGFPVTIIRPSHTLGLGRMPAPLTGAAYTTAARIEQGRPIIMHDDGQSMWTLTASWDLAKGAARLAGNEAAIGEAFHITHDEVLTWNCAVREIGRAVGREPKLVYIPSEQIIEQYPSFAGPLRDDKSRHTVFDNSKIKAFVPHFQCTTSFRQYMQQCIAWYNENPARKVVDEKSNEIQDQLAAL